MYLGSLMFITPPVQAVFSWCSNLESVMIVTLVYGTFEVGYFVQATV